MQPAYCSHCHTLQGHAKDLAALKAADYSILPSMTSFMSTLQSVVALRGEVKALFAELATELMHLTVCAREAPAFLCLHACFVLLHALR